MRLFVAIPLSKSIKESLAGLSQPIEGVRWLDHSRYHLTLRFIGEVPAEKFREVDSRLEKLSIPRFSLEVKGLGFFPRHKNPRVLWAGIADNEILMRLQREVEQQCRNAGLDPEHRDYKPHITLAKVQGTSKRDVMSFINQHKKLRLDPFLVQKFVLYESKLHPDGAIHKPRASYKLTRG